MENHHRSMTQTGVLLAHDGGGDGYVGGGQECCICSVLK